MRRTEIHKATNKCVYKSRDAQAEIGDWSSDTRYTMYQKGIPVFHQEFVQRLRRPTVSVV